MARDGISAEVLIGAGGFGLTADRDVQVAWSRLGNDWLADAYSPYYDRFAPGITLPVEDMDAAVAELERVAVAARRHATRAAGVTLLGVAGKPSVWFPNDAQRYGAGQWPTKKIAFFDQSKSISHFDDRPASVPAAVRAAVQRLPEPRRLVARAIDVDQTSFVVEVPASKAGTS